MKQNNAEFTNVSSFTLLLMCSTYFHCCAGYFFIPVPPEQFFPVCVFETPQRVYLTGPVLGPLVLFASLATEVYPNLTQLYAGLLIP